MMVMAGSLEDRPEGRALRAAALVAAVALEVVAASAARKLSAVVAPAASRLQEALAAAVLMGEEPA